MNHNLPIRFTKLSDDAITPTYATDGSAAFDLYATNSLPMYVGEARPVTFQTGLAVEVPDGHVLLVFSRSGHGFKSGVRLANCVGVIDPDYRGSIDVKLTADEGGGLMVHAGDRIAQAMLFAAPRLELIEVDSLPSTERGRGGFGSTGA